MKGERPYLVIPLIISCILMAVFFPIPNGRRWTDAGAHFLALSKEMNDIEIYAPARGSTLYTFTRPLFLFLQRYVSYEVVGLALFCLSLLASSCAIFFIAAHLGFTRLQAALVVLALGLGANLTLFGYGRFFTCDYGYSPRTVSTAFLLLALLCFLKRAKGGFLVANLLAFFFHPIHALVFNIALLATSALMASRRRKAWRWTVLLSALVFLYIMFLGIRSGELGSIFGQPQIDRKMMYSVFVYSRHSWYSIFDREHLSQNVMTTLFLGSTMLVYLAMRKRLPEGSLPGWDELMLFSFSSVALVGVHALNDLVLMDYSMLLLSLFRNAFVSIFVTLLFCAFLARRALGALKCGKGFIALALLVVIAGGLGRIKLDLVKQERFVARVEAELDAGYRPLFGDVLVLAPPHFSTQYCTNLFVSWKLDPTDPILYPEWVRRMDMVTGNVFSAIASANARRKFWQQPSIPSSTMWNELYLNLPETAIQSIAEKFGVVYVVTKAAYNFPLAFELNDYDGQIYYVYQLK